MISIPVPNRYLSTNFKMRNIFYHETARGVCWTIFQLDTLHNMEIAWKVYLVYYSVHVSVEADMA